VSLQFCVREPIIIFGKIHVSMQSTENTAYSCVAVVSSYILLSRFVSDDQYCGISTSHDFL